MPLTDAQDTAEHEMRMEKMAVEIDNGRVNIEKLRNEIRMQNSALEIERSKLRRQTWSIVLTGVGIVVAAFAAGATWMNYLGPHHG